MEELVNLFKYWNNRGKSAICRYILQELGVSLQEFGECTEMWKERKLVKNRLICDKHEYVVIIE